MPNSQHLKIGITGGMGVGKTTVCQIFERLGVPVYNADIRAKHLMQNENSVRRALTDAFGLDTYTRGDELNRTYLAKIVFNNPAKLELLNSIVHPAVFEDYNKWVHSQKNKAPYSLKEAALMFETESYKQLDKIIVVTSPINVRIDRIVKRDHMKADEALKRIHNQMNDRDRLHKADFVIKNDGKQSLIEQSLHIHHEIIQLKKTLNSSSS